MIYRKGRVDDFIVDIVVEAGHAVLYAGAKIADGFAVLPYLERITACVGRILDGSAPVAGEEIEIASGVNVVACRIPRQDKIGSIDFHRLVAFGQSHVELVTTCSGVVSFIVWINRATSVSKPQRRSVDMDGVATVVAVKSASADDCALSAAA